MFSLLGTADRATLRQSFQRLAKGGGSWTTGSLGPLAPTPARWSTATASPG